MPANLHPEVEINSWKTGPVFDWLAVTGRIAPDEMRRTFNCGVGMVIIVAEHDADSAIRSLCDSGEIAWNMGSIADGAGEVAYV